MKTKFCCLCAVVVSFCHVPDASGQVLIENFPSTDDPGSTISSTAWKGVSFTTPNQAYYIDNVVLRLANYTAATSPNPAVGFYTDAGSEPGTLVGSLLTDPPLSGSTATASFTFLPSGNLTLAANTTYWLVIAGESGTFQSRSTSTAMSSDVSATPGSFIRTSDAGANWLSSTVFNSFQVNVTPVPEPVHFTLGGAMALLAFAGYRRCRAGANRTSA